MISTDLMLNRFGKLHPKTRLPTSKLTDNKLEQRRLDLDSGDLENGVPNTT